MTNIKNALDADQMAWLEASWAALLCPFGAASEEVQRQFHDLSERYAEPQRYYHTLRHIADVLASVAVLGDHARDLPAVQLAAWFHDVIYDPRSGDNEEQSAAHAATRLTGLHVSVGVIDRVQRLILATKTHDASAGDLDCMILLDADLAILGAGEADYASYAGAIRQEYAWVPDEQYRTGRTRILQQFLQRERIYRTERMHQARESRARANLGNEIASLCRMSHGAGLPAPLQ
jgi:predicted metal-dependent HD superfamily phosphohydrolase